MRYDTCHRLHRSRDIMTMVCGRHEEDGDLKIFSMRGTPRKSLLFEKLFECT